MGGRKPKSAALRLLGGNPGRRPLRRALPVVGPLTPPARLSRAARTEWRRVMGVAPPGWLTAADREVLALYCENVARLAELERIAREGLTVPGHNKAGHPVSPGPAGSRDAPGRANAPPATLRLPRLDAA